MKADRLGELLADPVWDESLIAEVPPRILEMVLRYVLGGELDRTAFEARKKRLANPEIQSKAMTLAQACLQEGRQEGPQKVGQEDIVEAFEIRFGEFPDGLAEAVRLVDNEARLRDLLRGPFAARVWMSPRKPSSPYSRASP